MKKRATFCACLALAGCAGRANAPSGPPPEYEPPRVLPWDAGAAPSANQQPFVDEIEREADAATASDAATGDGS